MQPDELRVDPSPCLNLKNVIHSYRAKTQRFSRPPLGIMVTIVHPREGA